MTPQVSRFLAVVAGALMTPFVLAGCGSDQADGTGSAGTARTPSTSARSSPTGSPASEPATASPRPSAEDCTDYQACFGGDCEIAVSKPVTITLSDSPVDAGPFTVQKVKAGSVAVRMALPAGPSLSTTIKEGCTTAFYANNASGLAHTSCTKEPGDITGMYVKQTVTVEDITDGTAILTLKSE